MAAPPDIQPVAAKARSVKKVPAPERTRTAPYIMNITMNDDDTAIGTPNMPSRSTVRYPMSEENRVGAARKMDGK